MKKTYVVFSKAGTRIFVNPSDEVINNWPEDAVVLIDPVRVDLDGVPPHLWEPNIELNEIHPQSLFVPTPVIKHFRSVKLSNTREFWYQVILVLAVVEAIELFIRLAK